jgi:hypothetical protein
MKHKVMKITKLTVIASLAIVVISFYSCAKAGIGGPSYAIDGVANGAQVVPSSSSSAIGTVSGSFDGTKNTMKGKISWSNLSGAPTAIHIHAGMPGKNGYPYFILVNVPKGATDSLNFTSAFTEALEGTITAGAYYFDIHTAAYPNGEIRGQIVAH